MTGPRPAAQWAAGMAAVCLGIAASVSPGFLFGALFVEMREEFHHGDTISGLLVAAFFGASALLSAPIGRWVDERGPDDSLRIGLTAAVALQALIALVGRSIAAIVVLALAAGVANALCQVSANVWIARHVPRDRQGVAFAAKQSSMPAAALLAGVALPVLALNFGWRVAFSTGTALGLIALCTLAAVGRYDEARVVRAARTDIRRPSQLVVGGDATLRWLAVAAALSSGAAVTLGGFYVNSAVHAGVGKGDAGLLLAAGSAVSIGSRLGAGAFADRRRGSLLGLVAAMLAVGGASYMVLALGTPLSHVVALPLAFGAGWAWPGVFNLSVVRAHPYEPGRATGITQSGTYVGASAGPMAFGLLADHLSYRGAWLMAAVIGFGAAAAALNAGRLLRRREAFSPATGAGAVAR